MNSLVQPVWDSKARISLINLINVKHSVPGRLRPRGCSHLGQHDVLQWAGAERVVVRPQ